MRLCKRSIINKKYDVSLKERYEKLVYSKFKNDSPNLFDKNYIDLKANQEFESLSIDSRKVAFYDRRLKRIMQIFFWFVGICIGGMFYIFLFEK